MSQDERARQAIGVRGQEVVMRGRSVVLTTSDGQREWTYTSDEAIALLAWLYLHREDLYQAALVEETHRLHQPVPDTPKPKALS